MQPNGSVSREESKSWSRRWLYSVCALAVVGIIAAFVAWKPDDAYWSLAKQPTMEQLVKDLGGPKVVKILQTPDRVTAALVAPPTIERSSDPREYKAVEEREVVPAQISQEIGSILVTPEMHREVPPKACMPVYGVRVSYFRANDKVDVYFCFECAIFEILLNDQPVGGMNFDFPYFRLINAAQELFPNNKELAQLERERRS